MEELNLESINVGFIGGGKMASAISDGLIRKGVVNASNVWVSARTEKTLSSWKSSGVNTTFRNGEVVDNCDLVFLAVKPHILDDAIHDINVTSKKTRKSILFISVLAGIPLDTLFTKLKSVVSEPRVVRSLPNTPMMIGEGITVYCHRNTVKGDVDLVQKLFSYTGVAENVPESQIDAIGGLSGCGPAFAYVIIEALADGAVKMGVPRAMATKFAAQVLVGAGKMVLTTEKHPGQLKDEVCSAGGTTITGIHAIERGQVRASMMNAVEAAANKSKEIASRIK